jgi:hypothetical protein
MPFGPRTSGLRWGGISDRAHRWQDFLRRQVETESLRGRVTLGGAIGVDDEVVCEYEGLQALGISAHAHR